MFTSKRTIVFKSDCKVKAKKMTLKDYCKQEYWLTTNYDSDKKYSLRII